MIIITGNVLTNAETRAELEAICVAHSQRSRAEPGCIAHNVHEDCENKDLLVFIEKWADADAVKTHFAVPESGGFVAKLRELASVPPTIEIYSSQEVPFAALSTSS